MANIDLNLDISKVMVAHNNYDLFERGFYSIEPHNNNTLDSVIIPDAALTAGKSFPRWIDPTKWGYGMNCGYYSGAGPLALKNFILNKGFYNSDDLHSKIQSNNVIIYDFNSNELEAYNTTSTFDYYPFHVRAKKDGTIVFLLEFIGTHRSHSNKDQIIPDVQKTIHFAYRMFNTDLRYIMYIGNTESSLFDNHSVQSIKTPKEHHYNLILDFFSFEIWIDYPFSREQKTIQFDDEFRQILHGLDYPILNKKFDNDVLQAIDRFTKKDQQTDQIIWVTPEKNKTEH